MASKTIDILVRVKGNAEKALKGVTKQLKSTETQGGKTANALKGLAIAGAGLVVFKKVADWSKESIRLAQVQEKAEVALASALGHTSKELLEYASALQQKTVYGDEEILQAQARLAVFVKDEQQLKALTKATIDFASANQMDLNSAFALVGKSVGSSTNALVRYGVQIEGAVGSAERAQSTVKNLSDLFEGQAEAMSKTSEGKAQQYKNQMGDIREEIGSYLLPAVVEFNRSQVTMASRFAESADSAEGLGVMLVRSIQAVEILTTSFLLMGDVAVSTFIAMGNNLIMLLRPGKALAELVGKELPMGVGDMIDSFDEFNRTSITDIQGRIDDLNESTAKWSEPVEFNTEFKTKGEKPTAPTNEGGGGAVVEEAKAVTSSLISDLGNRAKGSIQIAIDTAKERKAVLEQEKADYFQFLEDMHQGQVEAGERARELKDAENAKAQERREQNIQASIDAAQTITNSIFMAIQSRNNARQQEYDNEISKRKEDVKSSGMSAKQKAKALEKIEKDAEKKRHEMRMAEWRQSLIMSLVNTALGVTKTISTMGMPAAIPGIIATGIAGGISTGIIASNKPKMYNGGLLSTPTGQRGDVIPFTGRDGERVVTPEEDAKQGASNTVSIGAPQITINGNVGQAEVQQIQDVYNDFTARIEEAFQSGSVNPTLIKSALAV